MSLGLVGRKIGMTRVFTDEGDTIPVTVVDVSNNRVTQIKTAETDGYAAVQVAYGKRRANRVNKAAAGHFAKAARGSRPYRCEEFRIKPDEAASLKVGGAIGVDIFKVGQKVDVSGTTQGKGFAGVIKRHHFSSNRASHGNSVSHNKPGSIGMNQDPGRVFPGKRMAGHLGAVHRTVQNVEIVRVDAERQLLLITRRASRLPRRRRDGEAGRPRGEGLARRPSLQPPSQLPPLNLLPPPPSRRRQVRERHGTPGDQRAGQVDREGRGVRRGVRARIQRVAGASGRHGFPGQCAAGHAQAERAQRGQQVEQEAVEAEGHRPRARRHGLVAACGAAAARSSRTCRTRISARS